MSARLCEVDGCGRRRKAHGLCQAHLYRLKRHGDVMADVPISRSNAQGVQRTRDLGIDLEATTCRVVGCERPRSGGTEADPGRRFLCAMHTVRAAHSINVQKVCAVKGCERPRCMTVEHCSTHHTRLRDHGDTFAEIPVGAPFGAIARAAAER